MEKILLFQVCLFLLFSLGCSSESRPSEPGLNDLAKAFQAANQAASVDSMLSLYHLDGCDDRTINMLKGALDYELGLPIEQVEFESLSGAPEEVIEFTHDGTAYGPSLEPRYRMRVTYAMEDQFTSLFSIGKTTEGEWRIVTARPKPEPAL